MTEKDPEIIKPSDDDVAKYGRGESAQAEQAQPADGASQQTEGPTTEERLTAELADMKDKFLRAKADYQNLQTRSSRERQEAVRYANADFARELLTILDDFERAFEAAGSAETVEGVIDGMRILYDHFLKVLRDQGVEPIEADGAVFDPHEHDALSKAPSEEYKAGTVMFVHQRGYRLRDRVLRHARVVVSTGPAAAADKDEG